MAATINLVTQFLPYVDEMFSTESKITLLTNQDFNFTNAHTVKVYKISTASMNDYTRNGASFSRYGTPEELNATTEEFTLSKDRSFTYIIDKLDEEETLGTLRAASSLSRQIRDVVIPEVDKHVYSVMVNNAGTKPTALALTADNIYTEICKASTALDNAEVPETERVLVVTPDTYQLMKKCKDIVMETTIGNDLRLKGVISNLDGAMVVKVPANRLPENFGFMLCHPCATVAPQKLSAYKTHTDPPGVNGFLVEGRIVYDAFVLDNKTKAIYYQALATQTK